MMSKKTSELKLDYNNFLEFWQSNTIFKDNGTTHKFRSQFLRN